MKDQVLDTRDLSEKRDDLKEQILNSFKETFEHYADQTDAFEEILFNEEEIQGWKEIWEEELKEIEEIDKVEEECSEFQYGETLIHEDYFTEYCEQLCQDCGYISKDFPCWIEIDWEATAANISADYSQCEYQGEQYLFRT